MAFSSGGSTAAIHDLNKDGSIGKQVEELYMVPKEEIVNVNKTRAAVVGSKHNLVARTVPMLTISLKLYGAHAFDINVNRKGFVPHL